MKDLTGATIALKGRPRRGIDHLRALMSESPKGRDR